MDENHSVARVVKLHGTNIVQVEAPGPGKQSSVWILSLSHPDKPSRRARARGSARSRPSFTVGRNVWMQSRCRDLASIAF